MFYQESSYRRELFHTQVVLSLKIVKSDAKVSMDMGMKAELKVLDLVIATISNQEFDKDAELSE